MAVPEVLRPLRIDHWHKNGFVLLGVVAALKTTPAPWDVERVWHIVLSLASACLMSSANYGINEILDAPFDRCSFSPFCALSRRSRSRHRSDHFSC
ncbi:MAG: hypothetical protein E6J72_20050 [Deltaproteobacteria bacterium]|nr:MAG: hypothetical protein E6J72_20050 [Deltaproteobacteria bacterium]